MINLVRVKPVIHSSRVSWPARAFELVLCALKSSAKFGDDSFFDQQKLVSWALKKKVFWAAQEFKLVLLTLVSQATKKTTFVSRQKTRFSEQPKSSFTVQFHKSHEQAPAYGVSDCIFWYYLEHFHKSTHDLPAFSRVPFILMDHNKPSQKAPLPRKLVFPLIPCPILLPSLPPQFNLDHTPTLFIFNFSYRWPTCIMVFRLLYFGRLRLAIFSLSCNVFGFYSRNIERLYTATAIFTQENFRACEEPFLSYHKIWDISITVLPTPP